MIWVCDKLPLQYGYGPCVVSAFVICGSGVEQAQQMIGVHSYDHGINGYGPFVHFIKSEYFSLVVQGVSGFEKMLVFST